MKRLALATSIVVATVLGSIGLAGASATWHNAQPVPGLSSLDPHNHSELSAVSCMSAGNCITAGSYGVGGPGEFQTFAADDVNGNIGDAYEILSVAALNVGTSASVASISCLPSGWCAAIGNYNGGAPMGGGGSLWVSTSTGGAIEIPGLTPGLNVTDIGYDAGGISCWSEGNCSAVGVVQNPMHVPQLIVADLIDGVWQTAHLITGVTTSGSSRGQISCWGSGECVVAGQRVNGLGYTAFMVERTGGTWGTSTDIRGMSTLTSGDSFAHALSCSSAGTCVIGGSFDAPEKPWLIERIGGTWTTAHTLSDILSLPGFEMSSIETATCWTATECVAGGSYRQSGTDHSLMINMVGGAWLAPAGVPGLDAMTTGSISVDFSSCSADGFCALMGKYTGQNSSTQVWAIVRTGGIWQFAEPIPGLAAMNTGNYADPKALSCVSNYCLAGGFVILDGGGNIAWVAALDGPAEPTTTTTSGGGAVTPAFTG